MIHTLQGIRDFASDKKNLTNNLGGLVALKTYFLFKIWAHQALLPVTHCTFVRHTGKTYLVTSRYFIIWLRESVNSGWKVDRVSTNYKVEPSDLIEDIANLSTTTVAAP